MATDKSTALRIPDSPSGRPKESRVVLWVCVPILLGVGLLAALVGQAIVTGAREAVQHTAAVLGPGDLTIQPESLRDSDGVPGILAETGEIFSSPALMRMPSHVTARVELPVEATAPAGGHALAVEVVGLEGTNDPQAALLATFLAEGKWPDGDRLGEPGTHQLAAGAGLMKQLGLRIGDAVRLRTAFLGKERHWEGRIVGIVHTELPQLDSGRLWTGLPSAQELLPVPAQAREEISTRIAIYLDRPGDAADWLIAVRRSSLPDGADVLTWRQANPDALPWLEWRQLQRREAWAAFGGVVLASLFGGGLAAWTCRHRRSSSLALSIGGPLMLGLIGAVGCFAALGVLGRHVPLPASRVFGVLGSDLNPFGGLVGPITPDLGLTRILQLGVLTVGAYALACGTSWWALRRASR
jgi:MacB-like periplasmic core domain